MTKQGWARLGIVMVSLALIMAFAVDVALGQQPPAFGTLRGRVVDAVTGDPVPRARLRLTAYGMTAVADDLGVYVFTGVPAGATTLIASAPGYRDYVQNIEIFGGQQTLDVLLTPAAAPPPEAAPRVGPPPAPRPARSESGAGLYAIGGMARLDMSAFNRFVDQFNQEVAEASASMPWVRATTRMDRVESGFFGEAGLRLGSSPFQLTLGAQYLKPSDVRATISSDLEAFGFLGCDSRACYGLLPGSGMSRIELAPRVIGGTARLGLATRGGPVRFVLSGGVGYYQATITERTAIQYEGLLLIFDRSGNLLAVRTGPESLQFTEDWTGSGVGYEGGLQVGLALGEASDLRLGVSYVSAVIDELRNARGARFPTKLELSGLRLFAGLSFGF